MVTSDAFGIQGHVSPGFEAVREAFVENFVRRRELGGACCAFHGGEKVVDLWGGIRNKRTGEPWEQDTMVVVYSATKGFAAMTMAIGSNCPAQPCPDAAWLRVPVHAGGDESSLEYLAGAKGFRVTS